MDCLGHDLGPPPKRLVHHQLLYTNGGPVAFLDSKLAKTIFAVMKDERMEQGGSKPS